MTYAMGVRKVKNYADWKSAFDQGAEMRKAAGMRAYRIFQFADEPNTILAMVDFDDPAAARKFMQSAELRQADERSGVLEAPPTFDTSKLLTEIASGRCE